ncbi:MAG: site-specific integrase [Acidobacteria bacterium]|nr:site-specific integrase [Acidobacteriota bacterium]
MRALIGVDLLRRLPPGPVDIRDVKLPGFLLRVRPSGTHSYYAQYGRGRWSLIGTTRVLTPPEAREQARQILADVAKGADPAATKRAERARITFETFIAEHYEPWASAQRKTGAEQTARLRAVFGPTLHSLRLDQISAFHVERWRSARLKADIQPTTVNRDLSTLRGALSRAVEWRLLTVHPLAMVKASKVDRGAVVRYLSADEEARLLAALAGRDEHRRAERDHANRWREERGYPTWPAFGTYTDHLTPIVLLALHTGLRRGELLALRWADVDLVAARVTVRGEAAKSGQTRHVPLNVTAAAALATWRAAMNPDTSEAIVFPGADGAALADIKKAWGALRNAAHIEHFRFHDCRHDFASKLVMAGVDLNTVRELLGHADIKMVLRYAHLAPEHMRAAVAKLITA